MYRQGLKIPMPYVLENKPRVTFLVIGYRLVLWHNNTYKKNYFPTVDCHSRFANKPAA